MPAYSLENYIIGQTQFTIPPTTTEDLNTLVVEQCVLGRNCAFVEVAPCVAECLEEEVGLPQDCGLCVGLVTECILRACLADCTDPESTACDECVAAVSDECNEVYEPCAGFPVP